MTVREEGREEGEAIRNREFVLNMHRMGFDIEKIVQATKLTRETVKKIIKEENSSEED
ncbi:MAG TPA: hypothetical protein PLY23_02255 [Alphaproteobacteria bacterium]|nr:hypothetical protein [Alphaproteobacteria bacterium]HQS93477.1 hypothetical protein [Alphaproteobacteria bacterium]